VGLCVRTRLAHRPGEPSEPDARGGPDGGHLHRSGGGVSPAVDAPRRRAPGGVRLAAARPLGPPQGQHGMRPPGLRRMPRRHPDAVSDPRHQHDVGFCCKHGSCSAPTGQTRWTPNHRRAPRSDPALFNWRHQHRVVKRRVNPGLGWGACHTAPRTLQGDEAMPLLRKGQRDGLANRDVRGQTRGSTQLVGLAAERVLAQPLLPPRSVFATLPPG
jgi:hypothetical protein